MKPKNSDITISELGEENTFVSGNKNWRIDYADLLAEMESLGYNIKVISKQNRTKYLANYRELRA